MKESNDSIAYCGLNCFKCDAYIATQANDEKKRAEVAKGWSDFFKTEIKPEDIICDGCRLGGRMSSYCNVCEIRKCCMEKEMENCAGCDMYICDKLESFFKLSPDARTTLDKLRK